VFGSSGNRVRLTFDSSNLNALYVMLMQFKQNIPKLKWHTCKIFLDAKYPSPMLRQYIALNVNLQGMKRLRGIGSCKITRQKD